jgi:predicted nucleic acid-binding protein
MRAVLDTNVLISGVTATGVPHELLVRAFEGEYQLVVSVATLRTFRVLLL